MKEGRNLPTYKAVRLAGGGGSYILLPVLTSTQRDALSPGAGYTIWNSTTTQVEVYDGSAWVAVGKVYGDTILATHESDASTHGVTQVDGVTERNAAIATHTTDLDAHTFNFYEQFRVGDYMMGMPSRGETAVAVTADQIEAVPFIVARSMTVDRIAIEVTTLAAGKIARLGIYSDNGSLYPGALVVDAGTVSVDSTGVKAAIISQQLTKGIYWLVVVSDGTPAVKWLYRTIDPLNVAVAEALRDSSRGSYYYKAAVGSGALAATFPAGASVNYGRTISTGLRLLSLD